VLLFGDASQFGLGRKRDADGGVPTVSEPDIEPLGSKNPGGN
jgi:hypothetical protein